MSPKLLVCDDDPLLHKAMALGISHSFELSFCSSAASLLVALKAQRFDLVLLDLDLGQACDGFWALHQVRQLHPAVCVVMHSASSQCAAVVKAMRLGAHDYVAKGCDMVDLVQTLNNVLQAAAARQPPPAAMHLPLIGQNTDFLNALAAADRFAQCPGNVLIGGEPGTGKDSVAYRIHGGNGPFVHLDGAAFGDSGVDSTLFGHERGAFAGADTARIGLLEEAGGGTLYIDEVGSLPLNVQARLLRVLEIGEFRRLGSNQVRSLQMRVVAASHRDLPAMVTDGSLRADLYSRLAVFCLDLPPLRQRRDDIPILLDHLLERYGHAAPADLPLEVIDSYLTYAWPGNVRELANTVQYMLAMAGDRPPSRADLPRPMQGPQQPATATPITSQGSYRERVRQYEAQLLEAAYKEHSGRVAAMSKQLGLDRSYLYAKLKTLGILPGRSSERAEDSAH